MLSPSSLARARWNAVWLGFRAARLPPLLSNARAMQALRIAGITSFRSLLGFQGGHFCLLVKLEAPGTYTLAGMGTPRKETPQECPCIRSGGKGGICDRSLKSHLMTTNSVSWIDYSNSRCSRAVLTSTYSALLILHGGSISILVDWCRENGTVEPCMYALRKGIMLVLSAFDASSFVSSFFWEIERAKKREGNSGRDWKFKETGISKWRGRDKSCTGTYKRWQLHLQKQSILPDHVLRHRHFLSLDQFDHRVGAQTARMLSDPSLKFSKSETAFVSL